MTESKQEIKDLLDKLVTRKGRQEKERQQDPKDSFARLDKRKVVSKGKKEQVLKEQIYSDRFSEKS